MGKLVGVQHWNGTSKEKEKSGKDYGRKYGDRKDNLRWHRPT